MNEPIPLSRCQICGEEFEKGDRVVALETIRKGRPGKMAHLKCFKPAQKPS